MFKFQIHKFTNGLHLITAPIETTEAVTVLISVKTGGRYETDGQQGISHFLEHLFFKGSKKYPSTFEISKELDSIGANYNASTSDEITNFYIQSSAKDFPKAFDVISDMFLNPLFDNEELEREKGVILQEANMYRDTPQSYVQILNQQQMYAGHPLGKDLIGTPDTIRAITRGDITKYRDKSYDGANTIIVIAGNLKDIDAKKVVEDRFSTLSKGEKSQYENVDKAKIVKLVQHKRKVDQTHFVLSYRAIPKTDPRRFALACLNVILGSGMSSRLFMEIRAKRALAYYIYSSIGQNYDTGLVSFAAGVKKDKLDEALSIIKKEISDLCQKGPSEDELNRAKGNLRGQLALSLEDSFEIASYLTGNLIYYGKIKTIESILEDLEKVTAEDVKKLSQEIFKSDKMGLAVVGPKEYKIEI